MTNIFEKASRKQYRFKTSRGLITTEDLWSLSLESLNAIAISIHKGIKDRQEVSFISTTTEVDRDEDTKLEIVKHVIAYRMKLNAAKKNRQEKSAELESLKTILMQKKNDELNSKSLEEIQKRIDELQGSPEELDD